ncbi:hypothetical protein LO762_10675 [Actinocorallia sp. API 0066]|uniref:hypothetical protein n=1 Tax=Actinocorallia sp. API 0066 TaxID=2896846 RepID=UPI001E4C90C0|nr:hypothetical protein [Actinocorallia sp. API 0066]MCD0449649.1 hypothetical protein [Actinocorallia sp. API 0066]
MSAKKTECLCVVKRVPGRVYPLERGPLPGGAQFTPELVREVGDVLAAHGFPRPEDLDRNALMWVLFRFVWGAPVGRPGGGVREGVGG